MFYFIFFVLISLLFVILPTNKVSMKVVKLKSYIFPLLISIFLILIVVFSKSAFNSARRGFMLWVNSVIPSLLPFFICIELLKKTNFMKVIGRLLEPIMRPIFNIPGCGAIALAMGISSGYPIGAKITSDLYEEKLCTKVEAERLLAFTNTSGPLFIIGAVGIGMFGNSTIGILLLLTHFLSAISVGILFRNYGKSAQEPKTHLPSSTSNLSSIISQKEDFSINKLGEIMGNAIKNSINILLIIGGYITFFSVLTNILSETYILEYLSIIINSFLNLFNFSMKMSKDILIGLLEITNGIKNLSELKNIMYIEILTIVSFILGFGGFSVHMQVSSIIANSKLSMKPYLFGKLLQGIFASIYTYLLMRHTSIFGLDSIQTFSYSFPSKYIPINAVNLILLSISTIVLIGIFMRLFKIPLLEKSNK